MARNEEYQANTVLDFLGIIASLHQDGDFSMYRGQADSFWNIEPRLVRYPELLDGYDDYVGLQDHFLEEFKKYAIPHMNSIPASELEWLIHAQHHGLPTSLIDWSTNPLKALFFAVEDSHFEEVEGAVYLLEPVSWYSGIADVRASETFTAFYPEHINTRIIAQDACFIQMALPEGKNEFIPLDESWRSYKLEHKIHDFKGINIPASRKKYIRLELARLGITHRTIYPDINGVAMSVFRQIYDENTA